MRRINIDKKGEALIRKYLRYAIQHPENRKYCGKCIDEIREAMGSKYNEPFEIEIQIVWKKSRMWGSNPHGVMWDDAGYHQSPKINGCGYDKQSTCTALLLNLNARLRARMISKGRDKLPYGAGYGYKPYFEGGVGINCHQRIIETLGGTWTHRSGDLFDIITIKFK